MPNSNKKLVRQSRTEADDFDFDSSDDHQAEGIGSFRPSESELYILQTVRFRLRIYHWRPQHSESGFEIAAPKLGEISSKLCSSPVFSDYQTECHCSITAVIKLRAAAMAAVD
ncbi:hypothetical protein ACLOJK_003559 [Asimina triloba]